MSPPQSGQRRVGVSFTTLAPHAKRLLYLYVNTRRQIQAHESVDRLLGRLQDVDEALVGPDLELLLGVLVDERAADYRELLDLGGQRHGACHQRACALGGLHYLLCRLVEYPVIESLEPDPNLLLG